MPKGLRLSNEDIRLSSEGLRIAVLLNSRVIGHHGLNQHNGGKGTSKAEAQV